MSTPSSDREGAIGLQAALDLAENVYETIREPLLVIDEEMRVFRANRAFYRMFGLSQGDAEGRPLYELDNGRWDIPALRHLLEGILPTQNPFEGFEVEHEFGGRGHRTVHLNARRVERQGLPQFILLAIEDVTERKRSEGELLAKVEALGAKDREKDEFLAMLSHELRNPLNALGVALELAAPAFAPEEGHAGGEYQEAYEIATRQVANMKALVNDLLEVSRLTRGKVELRRQRISLGRALSATVRAIEADVPDDGRLRFVTDVASGVWVDADPMRLDQVFQNLLGNAVKFTERGEIRVTMEAVEGHAVVRVSDTGAGVDPAFLPHLFELFQQGERTLARSEGGLGIGLTVTKELVELHGGTVEARSEGLGRGAEFVVRLPLGQAEAPAAPPPAKAGPRSRASVLVVDDNRDAADVVAKLLRRLGHDARAVYHGDEVVPAIVGQRPDLVLLDIGLPGKDGYELAGEIRADEGFAHVRLVALTGYGQPSDVQRALEAGFDAHVLKPIDADALLAVLAEAEAARR